MARIQRNFCKHQFFVFTPLFASETREIFRITRKVFEMNFSKWSCAQNKMIRQRVGVKEQRILLPPLILDGMFEVCWQWRKFWLVKKSLALEVASCWQTFLHNKQNYAQCEQGLIKQIVALASFGHAFRPQLIQN